MYKHVNQRTQLSADDRREIIERAKEWKQFRRDYLFSQGHLADALICCKRTVAAVESGREIIRPKVELLRRFRSLKQKMQRQYPSAAPVRNREDENVNRLFERGA
jgi:DNA-binding XRE family transcriptional regulator